MNVVKPHQVRSGYVAVGLRGVRHSSNGGVCHLKGLSIESDAGDTGCTVVQGYGVGVEVCTWGPRPARPLQSEFSFTSFALAGQDSVCPAVAAVALYSVRMLTSTFGGGLSLERSSGS